MTNSKKNIFSLVIVSILALTFMLTSVFAFRKENNNVVRADETLINFTGSSFYVPVNTYYYDIDYTWSNMNWLGYSNFQGNYIWSTIYNGVTTYYYSNNAVQYVLDTTTNTWSTMTWTGLTSFDANYIWSIDKGSRIDYFYSYNDVQYFLDISTNTWTSMTWTGLTSFQGRNVWNIGNFYYYSNGASHYVLDLSLNFNNTTWSNKSWTGLTSFQGRYIWNIGNTYYYSYNLTQYVLDISTNTWSTITWNNFSDINGNYVWNIGNTYFYSFNTLQYVLDISTNTWSTITWNNFNSFTGNYIWNIGNSYYYSYSNNQYYLDTTKQFISDYDNTYFTSINFDFVNLGSGDLRIYFNAVVYSYDTNGQVVYSISNQFVAGDFSDPVPSQTSVSDIYDTTNYVSYFSVSDDSGVFYVPFEMFNIYNVKIQACFIFSIDTTYSDSTGFTSFEFEKISFGSDYAQVQIDNYEFINNYVQYFNSLEQSVYIGFLSNADSSKVAYNYYGDSSELLSYYLGFTDDRPTNNYYFRFNPRTYYVQVPSDTYNSGYIAGQTAGYSSGYTAGESAGYSTGYTAGQTAGYTIGYNAGANDANHYTFFNLIAAVIDAPISAFTGLFNFELLGVNIMQFITGLLTLAIVIVILKKVV